MGIEKTEQEKEMTLQERRKKIIGRSMLIFLGALLLLTFFSNTLNNFSLPKVTVETPTHGAVVRQVTGTGTVQPNKTVDLYVPVSLRLSELKVKTGDNVQKGQVLMTLDTRELADQLADARDRYRQGKLNLERLEEQSADKSYLNFDQTIEAAAQDLEKTRKDYETAKQLHDAGIGTEENYNQSLHAWQQSEREFEMARHDKETAISENSRNISNTELELGIQERNIARLEQQLELGTITAPIDGVVSELNFTEGSMVNDALPVYRIADPSRGFKFVTTVDADSAALLAVGDQAGVTVAALGGNTISGTITAIADNSQNRGEKKDLSIEIQAEGLLGGEHGDVDIFKNLKTYSILVPNTALGEEGNRRFVYLLRERRGSLGNEFYVQKTDVTAGDSDDLKTGIVNGIAREDRVVVSTDKPLSDGMRVMISP